MLNPSKMHSLSYLSSCPVRIGVLMNRSEGNYRLDIVEFSIYGILKQRAEAMRQRLTNSGGFLSKAKRTTSLRIPAKHTPF